MEKYKNTIVKEMFPMDIMKVKQRSCADVKNLLTLRLMGVGEARSSRDCKVGKSKGQRTS